MTFIQKRVLYPLLRFIVLQEAQYVLADIHEWVYGSQSSGRALVSNIIRAGYYWSHAFKDAKSLLKNVNRIRYMLNTTLLTWAINIPNSSLTLCTIENQLSWTPTPKKRWIEVQHGCSLLPKWVEAKPLTIIMTKKLSWSYGNLLCVNLISLILFPLITSGNLSIAENSIRS